MGLLLSTLWARWFGGKERRLLLLGLDNAGNRHGMLRNPRLTCGRRLTRQDDTAESNPQTGQHIHGDNTNSWVTLCTIFGCTNQADGGF